ncbi:hypothetical protein LCGC14_0629070 [marine sediment metagenome]|uniref:Uncharacterized protein n=1 Tax=marine sediment metagenome TaxID=412755 RepID=A0A0F9R7P2_9ZZZZ
MLNEYNTLDNWRVAGEDFSEHSSTSMLLQTYQQWLEEHFNYYHSANDETRLMSP